MSDKIVGKGGKFTLDGEEYVIRRWGVATTGNKRATSSSDTAPFTDVETSLKNLILTVEAHHHTDALQVLPNPSGANLQVGSIVENVRAYKNGLSGPHWFCARMMVTDLNDDCDIEGDQTFSVTIENKGAFEFKMS